MDQLVQVVEVLNGQGLVEALVVVEGRDLLRGGLRAEDPACGTPPGRACSRPKTTIVTMTITTTAWRTRLRRYEEVLMCFPVASAQ